MALEVNKGRDLEVGLCQCIPSPVQFDVCISEPLLVEGPAGIGGERKSKSRAKLENKECDEDEVGTTSYIDEKSSVSQRVLPVVQPSRTAPASREMRSSRFFLELHPHRCSPRSGDPLVL